jgi:large subunit ribosomal protein L25
MFSLPAKIRENRKPHTLRQKGVLPAILYGQKIKNLSLQTDAKEFEKIYQLAGASSLISLEVGKEKFSVLIHNVQRDPLSNDFIHADFYQPSLTEETEAKIPLVFEGEPLAVKELGGTLVKNIQEIEVKALPQNLPHEIVVDIEVLKTFDDNILIKDLKVQEGVKILKDPGEIVAAVKRVEKVEEELQKPVEEKVEEVEKAGEKEKEDKKEEGRAEEEKEKVKK